MNRPSDGGVFSVTGSPTRPPWGLLFGVGGVELVQVIAGLFNHSESIKTGLNQFFVVWKKTEERTYFISRIS